MKREAEIKERLISNAINLIAEGGFEKATVKELVRYSGDLPGFKMNDVYIYRIFGSKESLYEATFTCLDSELYQAFRQGVGVVGDLDCALTEKLNRFFLLAWQFVLHNERRCRCYVRYYYSVYFKGRTLMAHKENFEKIVSVLSPMFKEEADVFSIMHSVFVSLLDFSIRVYNGDLEDTDDNRTHIFNVLYCMVATYLKDSVKAS